jgi:hypothetical protein
MFTTLSIQDLVSFLGDGLLILLIVGMQRRGQRRTFPFFFIYLFVVLFRSEALLLIKPFFPVTHFYAYWMTEAATIVLSFIVIYEIYRHIAASTSLPVSKTTFFRINVGLLLFASIVAALLIQSAPSNPLIRTVFVLSTALRVMQLGLFAMLAMLSIFFGFFWTSYAFGIALGYGLYALTQLTNTLIRATVGALGNQVYVYATMLAYDCAMLIWLSYTFSAGEPEIKIERVPENNTAMWIGILEKVTK